MKFLVLAFVFCLASHTAAEARPETVDWSQYLETDADRAKSVKRVEPAEKVAQSDKKISKAKPKAKAKKRTAARGKKRRH
jgi:hypothetical protein